MNLGNNNKNDAIVIGRRLNSCIYAYLNNLPLLVNGSSYELPFDFFDDGYPLHMFWMTNSFRHSLYTRNGKKRFGIQKKKIHSYFSTMLSIDGKLPFCNMIEEIQILDEETLKVIVNQGNTKFSYVVKFNKLIIFDEENIVGLPKCTDKRKQKYWVLDWFEVNSGCKHNLDLIETREKFVNRIYMYPSRRMAGNFARRILFRDVLSVSIMTKEQIEDVEYSDLFVKYRTIEVMKQNGLKGKKWGFDKRRKPRNRPIMMDFVEREIYPIKMRQYENTKNITFEYSSSEELIEEVKQKYLIRKEEWPRIRKINWLLLKDYLKKRIELMEKIKRDEGEE